VRIRAIHDAPEHFEKQIEQKDTARKFLSDMKKNLRIA